MVVRLDVHTKSEDGEICLYDHEDWPCETMQTANAAFEQAATEMEAWAETMPTYTPPKSGTTGRAVATAAAGKLRALIRS